jgi:hypothetical protein
MDLSDNLAITLKRIIEKRLPNGAHQKMFYNTIIPADLSSCEVTPNSFSYDRRKAFK